MTTPTNPTQATNELTDIVGNATKLTPLQLNGIKLDTLHTILTPDYLDKLAT